MKNFVSWGLKAWNWKLWFSVLGLMILWPLVFPELFYLHVSIFVFLHIIGAMSLNLMMRAGLLSFAHAGFMGIGAYTSTLLVMRLGIPFAIAFPLAGLFPAIVALAFGPIILRLRGVYFVLTTFVFGEVIRLVFVTWQSLTGGSNGIYDIPPAKFDFFFFSTSLTTKLSVYYFSLVITLMVCAICLSLNKSQFGRALNTIHENEVLAECLGVNTLKYKVIAFSLGAFLVGIGGGIYAHYLRYISPADFTWRLNLDLIAFNVVGGIHFIVGPIIGTIVLMPLAEFLRGAVELQWIIYSALMILMVLFLPEGLASLRYQNMTSMIIRTKEATN